MPHVGRRSIGCGSIFEFSEFFANLGDAIQFACFHLPSSADIQSPQVVYATLSLETQKNRLRGDFDHEIELMTKKRKPALAASKPK